MTEQVQDKPTEKGILYNNILTFMILGVMSWVGVNIMNINRSLAVVVTIATVNKAEIGHNANNITKLRDDLDNHIHHYPHNQK